ncbi:uncharacterized protein HGUI_00377 [Hanseniaspora guilliermondii]|uniref:C2H2-type domain-containing protein n=1 Tax=Hanseniaspora guilliermondii TaxID=56406 RepID=A0A1L0CIN8_9ASCO|nr:uncharacterized protein HGUI_00377 [Hanseniaspora guilliermondii]
MSPKVKDNKNNKHDEDSFLINDQNNHSESDVEGKNREMSINSELFYNLNNRSVEPLDRTPSIGATISRGFSIVNSNNQSSGLSKRRQSFNKSKAMKNNNSDSNNQNTAIRRPSENLEPFQFKHPFGQPNTVIKHTNVKPNKKDSLLPPRSNSITSLLGAAAMMNSDSKRNSLVNFNMNDLDKIQNNSGSNNVGTMKPPKKLPITQKQQNNDIQDVHKAPSMSEFDFFGSSGRKDSFKAPSFIPQSFNDMDTDIFLNRKNSNVRGSMVMDNHNGRYSRTFSSGMQQFLNQNFGSRPDLNNGLSSDLNNNTNSNISRTKDTNQNNRRTPSVGASQFADYIKGNENAISDDDEDDHHPLHRPHQTSDLRGQRNGMNDYDKDDGMTTDDMIQLAHAAALAGGVPLSQQQHKQSFRSSFIGNGVNLQSLLQQDPTLSGNFSGRGRRSIRANSNTPMPMATPPLHAFGNSFSMMNNMGLNVAITSDEEDSHNLSNHNNDFDLFNQAGGLRDSFVNGLSGQGQLMNSSSSKSSKGKKKKMKKSTTLKKKNIKTTNDSAALQAKRQNRIIADAAFEAAAHASSLATMNKQEKESSATQRRGKKLEKPKKLKMNNITTSSVMNGTLMKTNKRRSTAQSNEPNIINENKKFMGQGVISEFNTNKKSETSRSMKSFGKIMKPSDFLTTTLTSSMEPTNKGASKRTGANKRKLPAAESNKKKLVNKGDLKDKNDETDDVLNRSRTQDEVEAAAALQIIAKSESPLPSNNRKDSMVQGVDTHLIHNEVDQMDLDMKNQLMNATYEGYGNDGYDYSNYHDNGSNSDEEEVVNYNDVSEQEDPGNETESSKEPSSVKETPSERVKPKRKPRSTTKRAGSNEGKKATRSKASQGVRKPPVLLAEPIRVANPIIPQMKIETKEKSTEKEGEGEGDVMSVKREESENVNTNENVAVLGATNVDQLMLILQARQKGFQKHIKKTSDGKLDIYSNPDIIPPAVELVGGVDKPKVNEDHHFSHSKNEDPESKDPSTESNVTSNRKMYVCKYCKKQFSQTTHLEVHVRSHVGLKPYKCEHCGKSFTQGGNLRTHVRLHTGEQPFQCEICSKRFSRKGNLQAHMLTHDKSKPFPCKLDNCEKSFTQLGNLKSHQNKFHSTTLNNLTLKLAEGLNGHESEEELRALDYLGNLYKNSNRGIKGRGKKQASETEA